jgi:chorismate mutase/prephenate dehydratase
MESIVAPLERTQPTHPLRVGYLGPPATFSYQAALEHFGQSAVLVPCRTIGDVFTETEQRAVDYGIVPVENSTEGAVPIAIDRFLDTNVLICAEVGLRISHFLMSTGTIDQINRVYSHPQGLAQCRRWLAEHLPDATQIETASTAGATRVAREPDAAAIAPEAASAIYDLPIIAPRIEDVTTNMTRFLVIGPQMSQRTGRDRTAIVFSVEDRAGALVDALNCFAKHGISLSRIESRPSRRRPWEYVFFVDLAGHPDDEVVSRSLNELRQMCEFVKILGSWPIGQP